jgi:superfamily II DNA/RNA helicase
MPRPKVRGKRHRPLSPGKKKVLRKKRLGAIKHKKKEGKISFDLARLTRPAVDGADLPPVESPVEHFSEFPLHQRLQANLAKRGLLHPTPIQGFAIPALLEGRDVIGIANTGTGKTAAFLLPLLDKTLRKRGNYKTLIVAPTRELAEQIARELRQFSEGTPVRFAVCIGGLSLDEQTRALRREPQFVIGTPGRLLDLMERRSLTLDGFQAVVLDEVDRMLDMGFLKDVKRLLSEVPVPRHLLFFSATLPNTIADLAKDFLHEPLTFRIKERATSRNVAQDVVKVSKKQSKIEVLHTLLLDRDFQKVIIFCRTKRGSEKLSRDLSARGFKADAIHGDKTQSARSRILKRFSRDEISILVATDVAARGLDIPDVTHVVNYDIPENYDDYVHRIGRTGRGAKQGHALTFVDEKMRGGV